MTSKKETTTYAVKLDVETKEELQRLIESDSEGTAGDFIEVLINTYKLNKLANTVIDTKSEIRELNALTSRICSIYNNLIERNDIALNNIKADFQEKLAEKDSIIEELNRQLDDYKVANDLLSDETDKLSREYDKLKKKKNELEKQSEKDYKLISKLEYETKELNQIREHNKQLLAEIKEFKEAFDELNKYSDELQSEIKEKDRMIDALQQQINDMEISHKTELEDLKKRLEVEKQQEILDIKQKYQEMINDKDREVQTIRSEKLQALDQYQNKYMERIEKLEEDKIKLKDEIEKLENTIKDLKYPDIMEEFKKYSR